MTGRNNAITTARSLIAANPLFLDTETTGLDGSAEIVEIAIVDVEGRTIYQSLIRPTRARITAEARAVHHITDQELVSAPSWTMVYPVLDKLTRNQTIIAYNADFDSRLIRQTANATIRVDQRANLTLNVSIHCAMKLYSHYHGEWDDFRQTYRWQRLDVAIQQCGINAPQQDHRATGDANLARLLVLHMAVQELSYG